jgi:hypothetical protein
VLRLELELVEPLLFDRSDDELLPLLLMVLPELVVELLPEAPEPVVPLVDEPVVP